MTDQELQEKIDLIKQLGKITLSSHSKGYKASVKGKVVSFSYISYSLEEALIGLHRQCSKFLEFKGIKWE